ncbi:MAG: hypothetical protein AB8F78_17425 [Saprospiraceae bacterium]
MQASYNYKIHLRQYLTGPLRSITKASDLGRSSVIDVNRELTKTGGAGSTASGEMRKASVRVLQLGRSSRLAANDLERTQRGISRVGNEGIREGRKMSRASRSSKSGLMSVGAMLPGLTGVLAGVFAIDRVVNFGGAVIDTLGKFEKMEAVLTNTLGNNSAAKVVLRDISNFAARTPFQVDELTQSWIKFANDGFRPTMAQMTLLGDLAASRGKSMDQLVEAHMDAKRFEFERYKEFGVSTKVQGEKIAFTFKNQTTVVKKSAQAVDEYMLSLGRLEGVQGGMAAISETTAGQLSNLTDKWEGFMLTFGKTFQTEISQGIDGMSDLVTMLKESIMWVDLNKGVLNGMLKPILGEDTSISAMADRATKPWRSLANSTIEKRNQLFGLDKDANLFGLSFQDLDRTATLERQEQMADWLKVEFEVKRGRFGFGAKMSPFVAARSPYGSDGRKGGVSSDIRTKTKDYDRLGSVIGGGRSGVEEIVINLEALNSTGISVSGTNLKEGTQQVQRQLTELMLSVVNDANYTA